MHQGRSIKGGRKERRYGLVGVHLGRCTQMTEIVARKPTGAARPSTYCSPVGAQTSGGLEVVDQTPRRGRRGTVLSTDRRSLGRQARIPDNTGFRNKSPAFSHPDPTGNRAKYTYYLYLDTSTWSCALRTAQ